MSGRAKDDCDPWFNRDRRWSPSSNNRVAILTRTKDRPVLLARCLASVLAQLHENWHLYLVNDGGERSAVDRLVDEHDTAFDGRITVFHHEVSLGMAAACNRALDAARGNADFIVVHDDDDSWSPDFLSATTDFLQRDSNLVYCAVAARPLVIYERIEGNRVKELWRGGARFWRSFIDSQYLLSRNSIPPICLLVRMAAAEQIGSFNEALPALGGWDYNLRLLAISDIGTIETPLAHCHYRAGDKDSHGDHFISKLDEHRLCDTLYRNDLVRRAIHDNPANVGLLHVLLRSIEENRTDTLQRLDELRHRSDDARHSSSETWHQLDEIRRQSDETRHHLDEMKRQSDEIRHQSDEIRRQSDEMRHRLDDVSRKLEWLSDPYWVKRDIAKEVWFEKQRWGIPYKLGKWVKSKFRKAAPPSRPP